MLIVDLHSTLRLNVAPDKQKIVLAARVVRLLAKSPSQPAPSQLLLPSVGQVRSSRCVLICSRPEEEARARRAAEQPQSNVASETVWST